MGSKGREIVGMNVDEVEHEEDLQAFRRKI